MSGKWLRKKKVVPNPPRPRLPCWGKCGGDGTSNFGPGYCCKPCMAKFMEKLRADGVIKEDQAEAGES